MPDLSVTVPFGFTFDVPRFLRAYTRVGVRSVQFYRNEQNPPTLGEALRTVQSAGLRYDSIHGVFGPHLNPSSDDPEHRRHCLKVYEDEGRLALDLGGPMVVVHPSGQTPGLKPLTREEIRAYSAAHWVHLHEFMVALREIGERLGVTYLIENQPLNCPLGDDPVELAARVKAVGSPRVRLCYDTGHAHITASVPETALAVAGLVEYWHIHDNDATTDDHRMPGDGTIDWERFREVLASTGNPAPRMLEVFYDEARVERLADEGLGDRLRRQMAL